LQHPIKKNPRGNTENHTQFPYRLSQDQADKSLSTTFPMYLSLSQAGDVTGVIATKIKEQRFRRISSP